MFKITFATSLEVKSVYYPNFHELQTYACKQIVFLKLFHLSLIHIPIIMVHK